MSNVEHTHPLGSPVKENCFGCISEIAGALSNLGNQSDRLDDILDGFYKYVAEANGNDEYFGDDSRRDWEETKQAIEAYIAERTKSLVEKVDRFEVIDHREYTDEPGRVFVSYAVKVDLSLQDDDRTLKVFVTDKALKSNERVSK